MYLARFRFAAAFAGVAAGFTVGCTDPTGSGGSAGSEPVIGVKGVFGLVDLKASTVSAPEDVDPDGYTVAVDDAFGWPIASGQVRTLVVSAGTHRMLLQGVAANCTVTSENPVSVDVPASPAVAAPVTWEVVCGPNGDTGAGAWDIRRAPDPG